MKYMITGSRTISSVDYINSVLGMYTITSLTVGGAKGVDTIAEQFCIDNNVKVNVMKADWDKHGKSAGFIRNKEMIDATFATIAIWDGKSKGTLHAIKESLKLGRETTIHLPIKVSLCERKKGESSKDINIKHDTDLVDMLGIPIDILQNKYSITNMLNKSFNVNDLDNYLKLLKLKDITFTIANRKLLDGVADFLVDKVLVSITDKNMDGYLPIFHNISEVAKANRATGLMATLLPNRCANRDGVHIKDILYPSRTTVYQLLTPDPEMERATALLDETFNSNKKHICISCDSDADGQDGGALIGRYLQATKFITDYSIVCNERRYGNGVNDYAVGEITRLYYERGGESLDVFLIITTDHGSVNDKHYEQIKKLGNNIKILVTDHHPLARVDGVPTQAKFTDAFVNPQDPRCSLPSWISGAAVTYSLFLNYEKFYKEQPLDSLDYLLPYCAITTISDMMDVSKPINRFFFKKGIEAIKRSTHGAWKVFIDLNKDFLLADSVSRVFAPYINACNRMGEAHVGLDFLLTTDYEEAKEKFKKINRLNNFRRSLQSSLTKTIEDKIDSDYSVSVLLDTSTLPADRIKHASGVVGIVANNIGDKYGKPCIIFAKQGDKLKGSGRGIIANIHLGAVLDYIREHKPGLIAKGGGHQFAVGMELNIIDNDPLITLDTFRHFFDKAVYEQTDGILLLSKPLDMEVNIRNLGKDFLRTLEQESPFGNKFSPPNLITKGLVSNLRIINDRMLTFSLIDTRNGSRVKALAFNSTNFDDFMDGDIVNASGELNIDNYNGNPVLFLNNVENRS